MCTGIHHHRQQQRRDKSSRRKSASGTVWWKDRWQLGHTATCEIHSETLKLYNHLAAKQASTNIGSSAVPFSSDILSGARMDLCNESSTFPNGSNRLGMGNNGQRHVPGSDRHRRGTRRPSSRHQVQLQDRLSVFPMFLPSSWTRVHCRLWRMQRRGVYEYSQQNTVPWRRQLLRWGIVNCLSQRSKRSLTKTFIFIFLNLL